MNKDWQPIEMELVRAGYLARVSRTLAASGKVGWRWLVYRDGLEPFSRGYVRDLDEAAEIAEQTIDSLQRGEQAEIVKQCSCGIEYTAEGWAKLPCRGVLDDGVERLEIRNCSCGSSIAVVLGKSEKTT